MQINFINVFLTLKSISLSSTEIIFNKQQKIEWWEMDLMMICTGWEGDYVSFGSVL